MVDVSKIKVGDEVTVRGVVADTRHADSTAPVAVSFSGVCHSHWVNSSAIATHTPKPREFKPGDRVTWGSGYVIYELVAIRDGIAATWNKDYGWQPKTLSDLRHADESE